MRIYFDENFSPALVVGLKAFQEGRGTEGVAVCSVIEEFGRGAEDEIWIPGIASRHGIAITQDLNINRTRAQWELCRSNKIGIIFIKPPKKEGWDYWQIIQFIVKLWHELKTQATQARKPFGFLVEFKKSKFHPL